MYIQKSNFDVSELKKGNQDTSRLVKFNLILEVILIIFNLILEVIHIIFVLYEFMAFSPFIAIQTVCLSLSFLD